MSPRILMIGKVELFAVFLLLIVFGCTSSGNVTLEVPANAKDFQENTAIGEYISSEYVHSFNEELGAFKKEMVVFAGNDNSFFVWVPERINARSGELRKNLFWGTDEFLYQLPTHGIGSRDRNKQLEKFSFSIENHNIDGRYSEGRLKIGCTSKKLEFRNASGTVEGQVVIDNAKFVPLYPHRKLLFSFTRDREHIYVDFYNDNLLEGEKRFFVGLPRDMVRREIQEVISFECDKPPIYVIKGGGKYRMPRARISDGANTAKKLGISLEIPGVPYYEQPIVLPLPCISVNER